MDVKGLTIKFAADTSGLEDKIKKVESASKSTANELKKIDRGLKFNPKSTTLLKQKFDALKRTVKQSEVRLAQLQAKQRQLDEKKVDKNSKAYRDLEREIIKTQNQVDRAKRKLREFGNVRFQKLISSMKSVGMKMQNVGRSMTMYVTAPLVAAGAVGAKKFAEVDKTMQLTNATMKNSAANAELLNKAMKSAAASSTFGMSDAATATLNFARAGLKAKEAAAALAPAMALAAGEGGDLDTVSNGLVATINGFHGSFNQAGHYADVFANACNNSALDVNSLSEAMSIAAPIFASAGYSVNDAALFMGVMANNGIDANRAANSLKTGLARLISPAKEGAKMMDALGISVTNSDGTMKDSVTIQKELHDAFAKLSDSEKIAAASAIFGKNQMAPWLALINTAPGDVNTLNSAIAENGTAMEMQGKMMQGFGGSLESLKSSVDVAATSLGEALAPIIMKVAQGLQAATAWFNSLSPSMQRVVAIVGMVVAAIGPLLVIVGTLMTAFATVGPVLAGAFAVITGPVGLAVAAVAGLVAAGIWLYKNWDKVKVILAKTMNAIRTVFTSVFSAVKAKVVSVFNSIKTTVTGVVNGVKNKVVSTFTAMKDRVAATFNSMKERIVAPIRTARNIISGIVSRIRGLFPLHIGKIFSGLKLPHFNISAGKAPFGLGGKGTKPSISVDWYAKAMRKGVILNNATIFGAKDGKLLGGGETGREVVVGANSLSEIVAAAVARGMDIGAGSIASAVGTQTALASGATAQPVAVNVYLYKNGPQMGRYIVDTYDTWKSRLG